MQNYVHPVFHIHEFTYLFLHCFSAIFAFLFFKPSQIAVKVMVLLQLKIFGFKRADYEKRVVAASVVTVFSYYIVLENETLCMCNE